MSLNSQYYKDKQIKLQQKLIQIKDTFIVDSLNMSQRLANEIQEIHKENNEITEIINKEEETKIPIKKKG